MKFDRKAFNGNCATEEITFFLEFLIFFFTQKSINSYFLYELQRTLFSSLVFSLIKRVWIWLRSVWLKWILDVFIKFNGTILVNFDDLYMHLMSFLIIHVQEIWILGFAWTYGLHNFIWDQSASRINTCSSELTLLSLKLVFIK